MQTLPVELMRIIVWFAPLFSKRVFHHAKLLLVGAILAPGKRSATASIEVAEGLKNLADAYFNQERYDEAESLYEQARAIAKRIPGSDRSGVAE